MKAKSTEVELYPFALYDSVTVTPGMKNATLDFGAVPESGTVDLWYGRHEAPLIDALLERSIIPLEGLLFSLGISYPNCWIISNVLTKRLLLAWAHDKPGDVDLVCGNIINGRPSLEYLVGVQIKRREINAFDKLKSFPTGQGTKQSHYTALMGFDRTLLLHLLIREPSPGASLIASTNFRSQARICRGAIKDYFERELYGYGWLGLRQAFGRRFDDCGGFAYDIFSEPPLHPLHDDPEVRGARSVLNESLERILREHPSTSVPQVIYWMREAKLGKG